MLSPQQYPALVRKIFSAYENNTIDEILQYSRVICSIGLTPQILIAEAGFDPLDLVIQPFVIEKAIESHAIREGVILELLNILSTPNKIYHSKTQPQSSVVLSYEFQNGKPIIIPIHKNWVSGRQEYNKIPSIYGTTHKALGYWEKDGLLLWSS